MAILSQCWTLTRKNILIALHRHTISTVVRAFLLPIAFVIFLSYARNLFIPPSSYGIGTSTPIRTLAEGLDAANGGRDTVASAGNMPVVVEGVDEVLWRGDGSFGTRINVDKSTNEVQVYLLPLQRAVDEAIVNLNGTTTALPAVEAYPYTSLTQEQRNTSIRVNYQGAIINILAVAFLIGMRWKPQFARIISYHIAFDLMYIPGWIIIGIVFGVGIFAETSMAIVIVYHILAGLALTSLSILGASFFKKAQLSGITVAIVVLLLGVVSQVDGDRPTACGSSQPMDNSSGNITVNGTGGLGIAPQKNVLWDELTVEEHIRIFNHLKSPGHRDSKATIRELVDAVDLGRKISAKSKTLSGGQKRKLQLGMMFTGGSAVCCVDEIAILSKGTLRAHGSSVELKEKLGGGYRVHLQSSPGHASPPDIDGVTKHATFGQAMYTASSSTQAAYIIRHLEALGLTDYQLSGPTIEDVFLQLADEVRSEELGSVSSLGRDSVSETPEPNDKNGNVAATARPARKEMDNFSFTRPAAFFLGDASSPATLAFRGNGGIYNGVFGQNILNTVLSNISISTQYSEFDVPWSPSTGDSLQLVVYFGLAMAAYPGFFSLYPTFERTRKIRELEYSNGVRSLPLWLAYLGFDFLFVLVTSALSVIIFAVTSPDAWYHVGTQLSAYAFAAAGQAVLFLCYLIAYLCTLTYAVFVLFAILLWYDSGSILAWYRRVRGKPAAASLPRASAEEGEPAAEDLARINSSNDGLRVLNLTKSFKTNTAVDNLTFGIKRGEVFALLGPNGAGKSTTISLIRGDIQPSKNGGSIYVENVDIGRQRAKARGSLGVTPQFDAMDAMTTREHLIFYARIRGVPDVEHNVEEVIKAVGLQAFTERMAVALSGGNKRKLSLGIALIGNPTVLLLDEPSSGMDAAAKRVMWQTLASVVPGRSLLLTTHSMEEADALADRAGIMAKRMLASGTSDHLREVHGGAYYVHLVMKSAPHTTDEEISALIEWVRRTFPGADVEDKTYHGQIRFSVPARQTDDKSKFISKEEDLDSISGSTERATDTKSGIGSIITTLEDHREELGLEHYGRAAQY
ncbi:putative Retinal-specific ATP-binding cassette transporter [Glarea lozoyensis 74030]|uniref:Putative Retinal-specific ATP-binding cassette transporter n=1 Tax=Glarea lozoyensis (strain ATCC 74030 / MF5533) TaxID=1104152 RepID=H0EGM0_GLAL7|nr:putative Retinal-specific ATP-binding cassette transporter [Glarea lozoyensis 74030]